MYLQVLDGGRDDANSACSSFSLVGCMGMQPTIPSLAAFTGKEIPVCCASCIIDTSYTMLIPQPICGRSPPVEGTGV